jgi:putative transposase
MITSLKIRLKPTKEQEILFWKHIGASRYIYNWCLAKRIEKYNVGEHLTNISSAEITYLKKENNWLYEIDSSTIIHAMRDLERAYENFFKYNRGFPKFKSKKKSRDSFYTRNDRLTFNNDNKRVKLSVIGKVKYNYKKHIPNTKYNNTRIYFDGKYWYLTFAIEIENQNFELTKETVGIDVGIKELAVCSNKMIFKNINKTSIIKKLKKKLKRKQRRFSKKSKNSKNKEKLRIQIKLIYRKINNIRDNHLHTTSSKIIKTLPSKIVVEDLNISGMMKNRHLSKAISEQKLFEFIRQIQYKSKIYGIEVVKADRFFPSSRLCCNCGKIKKDLKLSDRIYNCECGNIIDRDFQASINLANYK